MKGHQQDPSDHLTFRELLATSLPIHFLPCVLPPSSLYNTQRDLKPPHPFLCSPVSWHPVLQNVSLKAWGPVSTRLVTAMSPEPPVYLTPVSPQTQLLGTNGERRGLLLLWTAALPGSPFLLFIPFHTERWHQLRKCPGALWGSLKGKGSRAMCWCLH